MKDWLNYIVLIISVISITFFIGMTFLRMGTVRTQAKKYGMKKEVTDPWVYWISYASGFFIIALKLIVWIFFPKDSTSNLWLSDIIPSVFLVLFTRTIGKSVILRAEKQLYFNRLLAQTKDIHKFSKENNKWMLHTATGTYPVSLTNTTVYKIAEISGASIEKSKPEKSKNH